jgi:hypothetical protein
MDQSIATVVQFVNAQHRLLADAAWLALGLLMVAAIFGLCGLHFWLRRGKLAQLLLDK